MNHLTRMGRGLNNKKIRLCNCECLCTRSCVRMCANTCIYVFYTYTHTYMCARVHVKVRADVFMVCVRPARVFACMYVCEARNLHVRMLLWVVAGIRSYSSQLIQVCQLMPLQSPDGDTVYTPYE